ncbi:ketopantoate reductase PanE/ApbA C terminal-domain-containing protein [Chaetomium sp. MPI-SDFR-AT-0129]|nr:ketopantoate reductase PanE/ApbA C terminal-domain-containing protein [Chaetomium sp. MPI-SDFR-AT-0129]
MDKGIHVLGVGNLGKYVAFALRQQQHYLQKQFGAGFYRPSEQPPPTLILHREDLVSSWYKADHRISRITTTDAGDEEIHTAYGFRAELLQLLLTGSLENREAYRNVMVNSRVPISHLIVATKAHVTVAALAEVRVRLGPHSHILFLQNGMGVMEEVSQRLFPSPTHRPTYWAGICSAGIHSDPRSPFSFVHAGHGPLTIGRVGPSPPSEPLDVNPMVAQLMDAKLLNTEVLQPADIRQARLKKLVINAVINPMTALFECKNGDVFINPDRRFLRDELLKEAGPIVRALDAAGAKDDGSPASTEITDQDLLDAVTKVAYNTADNVSSMRQDVLAKRRTEIDYINGYLVTAAQRMGLPAKQLANAWDKVKRLEQKYEPKTPIPSALQKATRWGRKVWS